MKCVVSNTLIELWTSDTREYQRLIINKYRYTRVTNNKKLKGLKKHTTAGPQLEPAVKGTSPSALNRRRVKVYLLEHFCETHDNKLFLIPRQVSTISFQSEDWQNGKVYLLEQCSVKAHDNKLSLIWGQVSDPLYCLPTREQRTYIRRRSLHPN